MVTFIRLRFIENIINNNYYLNEYQILYFNKYFFNLILASSEIRTDYELNQQDLSNSIQLFINTLLRRIAELGVRIKYEPDLDFLADMDLSVLHQNRFDFTACQFFFESDLDYVDIEASNKSHGVVVNTTSTILTNYLYVYQDIKYFSKGFKNLRDKYILSSYYKTRSIIIVDPYLMKGQAQILINVLIWFVKSVAIDNASKRPIEFLVFFNNEKCGMSNFDLVKTIKEIKNGFKRLVDRNILLQFVSCRDFHARPSFLGYSLVSSDYGWTLYDTLRKDVHFASIMLGDSEFPNAYMRQIKQYMKIYLEAINSQSNKVYGDTLPLMERSAKLL